MIDRNSDPTVWDFIADLLAGRVHNELESLNRQLLDLRRIQDMSTANEQAILDAANRINSAVDSINTQMQSLKDKVATLQSQAESATAHEPEDLSQEFAELDAALSKLSSAGSTLESAGTGSGSSQTPVDVSVDAPTEGEPVSGNPDVTPLAGESGPTNPTGEGEVPSSEQPGPGTDTGTGSELPANEAPETTEDTAPPVEETAVPTGDVFVEGTETTPTEETPAEPTTENPSGTQWQ